MKPIKQLYSWMRSHPLTAVSFAVVLSSLATAAAFWTECEIVCWIAFALVTVTWAMAFAFHSRNAVILLISLGLVVPKLNADENEAGGTGGGCLVPVGVGVVVIGVGGFVIYKVYKFCQKKFPKEDPNKKKTNAPPAEVEGALPSPEYAASFDYDEIGSCPCGEGGAGEDLTTTVTLTLRVDESEGDVLPLSLTTRRGGDSWQDWAGFAAEMRTRGLTITGHAGNSSYAINGQPTDQSSVPIRWYQDRRITKIGSGNYTVTVEASPDLRHWFQIMKTEVEIGTVLQIEDTSGAASFYRYRSERTD